MLHGIPVNLKDLYHLAGAPCEAGSRVLKGHVAKGDSTVAARLKESGAVLIGKTCTNEFGLGFNTVAARCPWRLDLDCYSGGSSAGAAVSVAAGSSLGAFGTDTGGSMRVPGAINGVAALKPTYGRVSRHGIVPLSHSLDHPGLAAWTVEDLALLLNAVAGYDAADPISAQRLVPDHTAGLHGGVYGLRLGVERRYFYRDTGDEGRAAYEQALAQLEAIGARLVELDLTDLEIAAPAALILLLAEGAAVHRRWLRDRLDDYDPATRPHLLAGALIPAGDYLRAAQIRARVAGRLRLAFSEHQLDALLTPSLPGAALTMQEVAAAQSGGEGGSALAGQFRHGVPFNLSGQPALSVPCGLSRRGLPLGLQIVGRPFDEPGLLRIGAAFEATRERRRPALALEPRQPAGGAPRPALERTLEP